MRPRGPYLLLVLAALCWGTQATAAKYALGGLGPAAVLLAGLLGANLVLWPLALLRGLRPPERIGRYFLLGLLEPGLAYGLLTVGLGYTTATNASLLNATESCFVVLLSAIFLGERLGIRAVAGLLLSCAGVLALQGIGANVHGNLGDVLVVLGALSAALYSLPARGAARTTDALSMTTYQFTAALILAIPVSVLAWSTGAEALPLHAAPRFWIAAVIMGTIGYAASFLLYNRAIATVPVGAAGMVLNLIPVFGVALAVAFLGERLLVWHAVGAVLIGAGIALFPTHRTQGGEQNAGHPSKIGEYAP
ncbi:DMT family transporter [Sciscionella sediminilitoris]|uniref:DMT family transporter n=1 Tax=Sciscionella sediminilitoris TaxID=1445613 RepID=UPI0004DF846E|nr:DMT family transporter [Sciscionella sp. SE31]